MKIIYNKFLPVKGFLAINLFGVLFVRDESSKKKPLSTKTLTHESIHTAQMKDFCPFLPIGGLVFYIVYVLEWIVRLFQFGVKRYAAYRQISFEKEAYTNENSQTYLKQRKRFAWVNYLKRK